MRNVRFLLLLFSAFLLAQIAVAQQPNINFTVLTTKDGLSSNTVNAILKDRYGFMWFGTEDGLNKFDGNHFTAYRHKPGDKSSLQANEILSLHEDKTGNLWVGTSGGSLSLYDRKTDAFVTFPANNSGNSIDNNVIRAILSDHTGNLWIGHYNGVNRLDPKTGKISRIKLSSRLTGSTSTLHSICFLEDRKKQIWIGTSEGLWQYNPATNTTRQFLHSDSDTHSLAGNEINAIAEDGAGNLWVGTDRGLSKLVPGRSSFVNFRHEKQSLHLMQSANYINNIGVDKDKLWLATGNGVLLFDTKSGQAMRLTHDQRNIHSLSAPTVRSLWLDKEGIFWFGTPGNGVNKYDKNLNLFSHIQSHVFDAKGLNSPMVNTFAEAMDGRVFVGTEAGLSLYDQQTRLFQQLPLSSKRPGGGNHRPVLSLTMSKTGQLYVGSYGDGLFIFEPRSGKVAQLLKGPNPQDLNSNDIFCTMEDRAGNLWLGTNGDGINVLDKNGKVEFRLTPAPKTPLDVLLPINGFIRDIIEDRAGNIWLATHGGGIASYNTQTKKFAIYHTENSKLPNDKVQTLLEDRAGNIWVGTLGGGIGILNRQTGVITVLSEKDGLQNNAVYKIIEDSNGRKWVSSNKGISAIEPDAKKISNFNHHNGVQQNNFVRGAGLLLSNGNVLFGGLEGFHSFTTAHLKKNNNIPAVLLTGLTVANQSVSPTEDGPLQTHISIANEINLNYGQSFALRYVGLSYTAAGQNQYAYRLEGFDKSWNYVGNTTTAAYTNLDPGTYTFRVKASNNDGVWNEQGAVIRIRVHPPFWRTTYAYIAYALLASGTLLFIRHKGIQKLKRKFALEQEKMKTEQARKEAERIHELDLLKIKFLTNLSHEFRTPISLILGPVETLLQQQKNTTAAVHLGLVKRNAKRLLNLVNQLLDFRKMEEQELRLNATEGNLVAFVEEVSDSFKDLAERKEIHFEVKSLLPCYFTRFDHDKLERILFNLLSNAFKFTLPGGSIRLLVEERENIAEATGKWICLKVCDSGIGISADKKEKIFETFFQSSTPVAILNQGTGIGLSITREFVKLHGGTITVDSELEKGTSFTLLLPLEPLADILPQTTAETFALSNDDGEASFANATSDATEKPVILLVEDNDDFRFYLKDNLRLHYKVLEAANGKEGWQKALAHHPQLIVSDVSMPVMDGISFCRKIKADKRTGHIPVILLTALTAEEDQVKGLQTGANDYVTKPFNFEVLNIKIRNTLHLNNVLKNTYTKQIKVLAPEAAFESADEKLLQTIAVYLEENLTNSQLSVEELSRHVGMSRSTLYSRLLELTGQTPVEYIRSVKLEKAAVMLEKSDMNVAQVAYSAGFSTPNYFAKSFKAKYGLLPSEYMTKMRKEEDTKAVES
jgi:ligand-binding sensor domain-containing protein/signal transduction histidine kinase/DNA-binding response OmpR family regulator